MEIKILGPGCMNCQTLAKRAEEAIKQLSIDATVTKVTDYEGMLKYGMMRSPGLVIEEKLVCSGRVPSVAEITTLITNELMKTDDTSK